MDQELVERVHQSLQAIADMLGDINGYLMQLRAQTDEEIADIQRRTLALQAAARVMPTVLPTLTDASVGYAPLVGEPTPDPRYPYTAGRQPRRDGDSFGRVAPTQGGADGKAADTDVSK